MPCAITTRPSPSVAYFDKGVTLSFLDKKISAITHFKKALEIDPEMVEAHVYLADIYREQEKSQEAKEHYELALQLDPGHEKAREGLSTL